MAEQNPLEEGLSAFERAGTMTKLVIVGGAGLAAFLGYRQYKAGQSSSSSSGAGLPLSSGDATTQTTAGSSAGQPIYVFVTGPGSGSGSSGPSGDTGGSGSPSGGVQGGSLGLPRNPIDPIPGGFMQPNGTVRMPGTGAHTVRPRIYQGTLPGR